jgi:hypothetical protein
MIVKLLHRVVGSDNQASASFLNADKVPVGTGCNPLQKPYKIL